MLKRSLQLRETAHSNGILTLHCYYKNIDCSRYKVGDFNKQNFIQKDSEFEPQWGSEFPHTSRRGDPASCYPCSPHSWHLGAAHLCKWAAISTWMLIWPNALPRCVQIKEDGAKGFKQERVKFHEYWYVMEHAGWPRCIQHSAEWCTIPEESILSVGKAVSDSTSTACGIISRGSSARWHSIWANGLSEETGNSAERLPAPEAD